MARARNIKPGLFKNELLGEADPHITLLFVGLWCLADREGRLEDRPRRILIEIFPYRELSGDDVNKYLNWLDKNGFILRYETEGGSYIQIKNWAKHQNPHHKEIESIIPKPQDHTDTVCLGYIPLSNTIRQRIYDRDGKQCAYCGSMDSLNIDHIIPVSKHGNSMDDNLQVLCKSCNSIKGNNIVDNELSKIHGRVMLDSSINQEQVKKNASCPSDSLIPDSLIPDSLIPDSLIPDPLTKNVADGVENPPLPTQKIKSVPKKQNQDLSPSHETWQSYSDAYEKRYGVTPVRNATINAQLSSFIKRIGFNESPLVAAFYVYHNNQFYVTKMHTVGLLLADAEKLRTEWATKTTVTQTQARQADKTQARGNVFNKLIEEARANATQ